MAIPFGIKLRHLQTFLAVAEAGNISNAARRQHISQPALSKTINELEQLLGTSLFDRIGRRTVLTGHGQTFRRHAVEALRSLESGCAAIGTTGGAGKITVGVLPTVAGGFFPAVAQEFALARPEVVTTVITGPNTYLIDMLRAGQIDLMVGRMPAARDMPGLSFEYLYEEPVNLIARAGHPMAGGSATDAVRTFPLILPNAGAIIRQVVEEFLHSIGLHDPRPAFETVSLPFARGLLERSDMLWFISRGVVARELEEGSLVALDFGGRQMAGAVGLTRRTSRDQHPDIDDLIGLLHKSGAKAA